MRRRVYVDRKLRFELRPLPKGQLINGQPELEVTVMNQGMNGSWTSFRLIEGPALVSLIGWIGAFVHGATPEPMMLTVVNDTIDLTARPGGTALITSRTRKDGRLRPVTGGAAPEEEPARGLFNRVNGRDAWCYLSEWLGTCA